MSRLAIHRLGPFVLALGLAQMLGCGSTPEPEDAAVPEADAELDAEIDAEADAESPRHSTVPAVSDASAWGIAIPIGCTPVFARADWIECRCRLSLTALSRFYRFRFPAGRVEGLGRGYRFTPGVIEPGHAILNPFRGPGNVRSRLLLFPGRGPDDDGARRIIDRLAPARSRLPRGR